MIKNKRAVSPIIGYVLLITFGIVMSVIAYNYLKTYVPKEGLDCPEGVSVFLKEYTCDLDNDILNITIKNNGKFNIQGYFIYASNQSGVEIATLLLAPHYLNYTQVPKSFNQSNQIVFSGVTKNYLIPQAEITHSFNISSFDSFNFIEITPTRIQDIKNKERFVSCGKAKIREELICTSS